VVCRVTSGEEAAVEWYGGIIVHDGYIVVVTGDIGVLHKMEERDERE